MPNNMPMNFAKWYNDDQEHKVHRKNSQDPDQDQDSPSISLGGIDTKFGQSTAKNAVDLSPSSYYFALTQIQDAVGRVGSDSPSSNLPSDEGWKAARKAAFIAIKLLQDGPDPTIHRASHPTQWR